MNPFYDVRKSHTVIAVFKGYIIMPNGDRPKVDQHTVPQVYLRGFLMIKSIYGIMILKATDIAMGELR